MATLKILKGLSITKSEEVHDYLHIAFSDGTTLSVFNNYAYDGGKVLNIEGKEVKFVEEAEDRILIVFNDDKTISVGLKDQDYNGPEAMVLKQEGKSPIVWN